MNTYIKTFNFKYLYLLLVLFSFNNCTSKSVYGEVNPKYEIKRFDKYLYNYLNDENKDSLSLKEQELFLDFFGKNVVRIGGTDSLGFHERLIEYFSESTLMNLYSDEQRIFADIDSINRELSYAMEQLFIHFPKLTKPDIYMHVSGLEQNVVVTDDILSISADKYLGQDYPLYQYYFQDYQIQLMSPDRIVPDYILGYLMANFPFVGKEEILLDRILYEGKLRYIIAQLIPEREDWEFVAYNKNQYDWCRINKSRIWQVILENKHLYTPDYKTTYQYIREAPYTAHLPSESPGRVGVWLGYEIICSYMKNNPKVLLNDLMDNVDYQAILKDAKFKP